MVVFELLSGVGFFLVYQLLWKRYGESMVAYFMRTTPVSAETLGKDPYSDIQPLVDFDWAATEPLQIRPFKPKYHMTMGRSNISRAS